MRREFRRTLAVPLQCSNQAMNMRAADATVSSAPKAMNILPISEVWSQVELSAEASTGLALAIATVCGC